MAESKGTHQKGQHLKIQVSRDRLADNLAYQNLKELARWGMDYFSVTRRRRKIREAQMEMDRISDHATSGAVEPADEFEEVEETLSSFRDEIPGSVYQILENRLDRAIRAAEAKDRLDDERIGLLGSLATAGMSALAYEHEVQKGYTQIDQATEALRELGDQLKNARARDKVGKIASSLHDWTDRARKTRRLFSHLLDEENRDVVARFRCRSLVRDVVGQLGVLTRGAEIQCDSIDENFRLPEASYAEWNAVFQNVVINAVNATLDSEQKLIDISSHSDGDSRKVLIQDTGSGVDLENSSQLFEPFVRKQPLSEDRRALGAGGSGVGLTIVRMLAQKIGCKVHFGPPTSDPFETAFHISWSKSDE